MPAHEGVWRQDGILPEIDLPGALDGQSTVSWSPSMPLEADLELVRGVGPWRRERLWRQGFSDLRHLSTHPVFGDRARAVLALIAARNASGLRRILGARDERLVAGLFRREELAAVDIETMGLVPVFPVFLVGLAWWESGQWRYLQLVARDFAAERDLLEAAEEALRPYRGLLTYNGRRFDLPFLRMRRQYWGLAADDGPWAVDRWLDLLPAAFRRWRSVLPDLRLHTVAGHLGARREPVLEGREVPEYFRRFVETGDLEWLEPVLAHNREDLLAFVRLWLAMEAAPGPGASGSGEALHGMTAS